MANTIDLLFADGEYTFALPLARIAELQTKCDIGIGGLFTRVMRGTIEHEGEVFLDPAQSQFYAVDLIETIRQGLIGGGKGVVNGEEVQVTPVVANRLIESYVLDRPLKEIWNIATSILIAVIVGYDPPKKDQPAQERAPRKKRAKADSTTAWRSPTAPP